MMAGPFLTAAAAILAFIHYIWLGAPTQSKMPYVVLMLGVIGVLLWGNFLWLRARRVRIDHENFYVSNYLLNEITIPFADVAGVSQRILHRNHLLTLHLAVPTKLGTVINFMPAALDDARFGHEHPLADELNRMLEAARS